MPTHSLNRWLPLAVALSLILGLFTGCAGKPHAGAQRASAAAQCDPVVRRVLGVSADQERIARLADLVPSQIGTIADTVFIADTIDLNCDGQSDFIGQLILAGGSGGLTLAAFVQERGEYREVLRARSIVDGPEALAIAADLTGSGKRDLVTLGSDEGGHVPRLFIWRGGHYAAVAVPVEYHVRQEAEWSTACLQRLNPGIVDGTDITLLRETIPLTALKGHGPDCALPIDTLRVVGESLVRGGR